MTVIEKLSDRGGLIFSAIKLILVNQGYMDEKRLQWELFQCGMYINAPLLKQAISVMIEKGQLMRPKKQENEVLSKEEKQ